MMAIPIILDNGSTTLQMVPWLVERVALTVMTNSLLIINEAVARDSNMTLLMPGGTYRKRSSSFHGGLAEQAFRAYTFDKLFIGADGFDIEQGTTTFNEAYQVSQSMCQAAKQIIVVTDSSKFGRKTPNVVVPIDKVTLSLPMPASVTRIKRRWNSGAFGYCWSDGAAVAVK